MRLLLADDSQYVRVRMGGLLRQHGFDTAAVGSVAEALAFDCTTVVAAILDVELGEESGVELARRVRQNHPGLPVAFLTSNPQAAQSQDAETLGPIFEKDWELAPLLAWLRALQAP